MEVTPLVPLLALALSALAILVLRRPAVSWGLADVPGGRKQHQGSVPLTGGLGMFIGFLLVQPLISISLADWLPFYAGVLLLVACGVVDDARDMSSKVKFGIQLLAAALMVVWGQQVLGYLGTFPLVGELHIGWLAIPFTVVAVAGLINAINMMDGVDGLAGGSALGVLAWLAVMAALQGQLGVLAVIVALGASVCGFLLFNMRHPWRRRASVFMGDAGSMALGFAIAWFVVVLSQHEQALAGPVAYGWLLALPVMDTLSLMVRRIRKGRSPFSADRDHLHHIFLRAGFTPGQTTMILMLLVGALGAVGLVFSLAGVPDVLLLLGLLAVFVLHDVFVRRAWRTSRALWRLHDATLGPAAVASPEAMVRLRDKPVVGGGRRLVALVGLYLVAFGVGLHVSLVIGGLVLVVASALFAYPAFWRDTLRLPLFWISLGLTLYVVLRAALAGSLWDGFTDWLPVIAITGLVSFPVAWWLANARLHWDWLLLTLVAGGVFAFVLQADWQRLEAGILDNPWVWGSPAQTGFLVSVGLMMLMALAFSGLQRLGTGWRPFYQVVLAVALAMPSMVILMATGFTSAWIATLVGMAAFAVAATLLGRNQGNRIGRLGVVLLALVLVTGVVSHQLLLRDSATLFQTLALPLQAIGLMLSGELEQARAVHAGMVERVLLMQQAFVDWRNHWLFGTGTPEPVTDGVAAVAGEENGYRSLLFTIGAGLGVVGLAGFVALVVMPWHAIIWLGVRRLWPSIWPVIIFSTGSVVLVLSTLAMPVQFPEPASFMVLLIASAQVAIFHRDWARRRQPAKR